MPVSIRFALVCAFILSRMSVVWGCPYGYGSELGKVDYVQYEIQDGQVYRVDVTRNTKRLIPKLKGIKSIDNSKINCEVLSPAYDKTVGKTIASWHNIEEPTLLAYVKSDGSVWIQGRIWYFDDQTDEPFPKPRLLFDSPHAPMRIQGIENAIKVVAGETWIAALERDHTTWIWGWVDGASLALYKMQELSNSKRPASRLFNESDVIDIVAYKSAIYGLRANGQVLGGGWRNICPKPDTEAGGPGFICTVIDEQTNPVTSIWTKATDPSQCNAKFASGEHWQWPCDLSTNTVDALNNVKIRLTKEKFKKFPINK